METFKPFFWIGGHAAWLAGAWLVMPLCAGEPAGGMAAADREWSRRSASVEEAKMLLTKGDEAYQAGRYAEAVEAYSGARELLPDAPVSAELRAAATERYAQASVEQARMLSRKGDVAAARETVDKVLREGVAPNDPGALAFRAQLDDPIRTNPALTAEHAKDVDEVRKTLYTAEGAYNLGKFDQAKAEYEKVLRIDPTNTAARRGMERVAATKSGYHQAAYDHTRAEMLSQVDAAWETQISAPELGAGPEDPGGPAAPLGEVTVATRIKRIIVPKIALDQATLEEAVEFLRLAKDVDGSGVNIAVNLGPPDSETAKRIRGLKFDLQLSQVPLAKVLNYLCDITRTSFTTDEYSVIITPVGSTSDELILRNYRVPPDFLTNLSAGAGSAKANEDPFAEAPASGGGLLTKRLSAQEALAAQGVAFPEGATASYSAATSMLRVINTAANQDVIAQIVDTINQTEPVTVSVKVTLIKTQQTNLKELGFDWLLTPMAVGGSDELFAAGGTTGSTPGRTAADFVQPVPLPGDPTALVNPGVVTNGLRSGQQGINTATSIDGLIRDPDRLGKTASVAPGILALTGLFDEGQVQMMMRGLDQKKGVDIMVRPSILTRSGQSSSVVISREFIYPTEYEPPELPNRTSSGGTGSFPVTPATPTAFEKRDVGVVLEVLPVADANRRYVDVTLNPSVTDFDGFVNYGSPITSAVQGLLGPTQVPITDNRILMPVFSTQKANTQLTVVDGATIVMGGLMAESIQTVDDKVPVLGSIPWVGRLFQSTSKQPVSTAIVFLVHVELLDPTGRPYRDR
jgi:general secretion pathway protein D